MDHTEELTLIPENTPLTNIYLPNEWILYLYDKQLFRKIANRQNFRAKPHKELCAIRTVNDLWYLLKLMGSTTEPNLKPSSSGTKLNLDANDYIIMKKGIEPIWEDPKNSDGGTFTIKMPHSKGYDVWLSFIVYMLTESLTNEMENINGITVSYISDTNNFHNPGPNGNISYTYLKIWDAKSDRTRDQFVDILPNELIKKIENDSMMYSQNNKKKDYGDNNIMNKLKSTQKNVYGKFDSGDRGGFVAPRRHR